MTALGMMEDHNRLLPSAEYGSGPSSNAMQNRGVLILGCVLVALGSLLCVGKESLAKQPDQRPEPGDRAANHGPAVAPNSNHPAPAAQTKPAPREPAPREPVRSPSSHPTEQRPAERTAPAGRRDPAQGRPAESPGKQMVPHERPVHEQRPAHRSLMRDHLLAW